LNKENDIGHNRLESKDKKFQNKCKVFDKAHGTNRYNRDNRGPLEREPLKIEFSLVGVVMGISPLHAEKQHRIKHIADQNKVSNSSEEDLDS
jgi:hypothetical protein